MYVNESVVIFILGKITEHLNESLFPTPDLCQHYSTIIVLFYLHFDRKLIHVVDSFVLYKTAKRGFSATHINRM